METQVIVVGRRHTTQIADTENQDQELATRIAVGDTDAWDRFFDRFSPWAYRFAYRHLNNNRADAEDLCSDIILTAAKSIGKYDASRGDLDAWVHGLARHRLSRFCRSRRVELPLVPDLVDEAHDLETATLDQADRLGVADAVNRALASLPERQASALVAKYVEGCTTQEMAASSDISVKAVESLLVRARASFRSAFNRLLGSGLGGENLG